MAVVRVEADLVIESSVDGAVGGLVDLHTHSWFSPDGSGAPEQGVAAAERAGVAVLAVTDHDTVAHIDPCLAAARLGRIHVVPGFEMSCAVPEQGVPEIHVLCYFPDVAGRAWCHAAVTSVLDRIREAHGDWVGHIAQKAGLPLACLKDAQARLVDAGTIHPLAVPSLQAVKRHALGNAPSLWATVAETRAYIRASGGPDGYPAYPAFSDVGPTLRSQGTVLTFAHPTRYGWTGDRLEAVVRHLSACGLSGLEAAYAPRPDDTAAMRSLAHRLKLATSIGSDVHDLPNDTGQAYVKQLSGLVRI